MGEIVISFQAQTLADANAFAAGLTADYPAIVEVQKTVQDSDKMTTVIMRIPAD